MYKTGDLIIVQGGHEDEGPYVIEKVLDEGRYELKKRGTILERPYDERKLQMGSSRKETEKLKTAQAPSEEAEEEKRKEPGQAT